MRGTLECVALRLLWVLLAVLTLAPVCAAQTQLDTSPGGQTGVQNYGSYFSAEFDTISLYNGNVMLNLGLFNLPGRELSMGLSLSYNSQKWEQKICSDGSGGTYCAAAPTPAAGASPTRSAAA